jgi:hypothetical protein
MKVSDLYPWTRKEATLSQYSTGYTTTTLLQMLNMTMTQVIEPVVTGVRSGFWVHTFTRTLGINNPTVRLPPRATPAVEMVEVSSDGVNWAPLSEVLESEAAEWMADYGRDRLPTAYVIRSSYIQLIPAAKVEGVQIRVKTTVRPNVLVDDQSTGLITDVDLDTRVIEVASLPVSKPSGASFGTGTVVCDAIEPSGNYERSLLDAPCTFIDSTHVSVAAGFSLARVQAGDWLRFANQSEWPQMPESFHPLIGSITAVPICRQRDLLERADAISSAASARLQAFSDHLQPRVRVQDHKPRQHNWD